MSQPFNPGFFDYAYGLHFQFSKLESFISEYTEQPMFVIEEGKRYVRRNWEISGVIRDNASSFFPFRDEIETYSTDGQVWISRQDELDLISEYKEPSMKEVDFKKPLRIVKLFYQAKYIGQGLDVANVVQYRNGAGNVITAGVDDFGNWCGEPLIENVPEKITQWCNFYPSGSGGSHRTREQADRSATSERIACVPVTFEPGEGL